MMTSLYIHIPFCERKCFYCSFVVSIGQERRADEYLQCLSEEADRYKGTTVASIYLGGGTPSLLTPKQLDNLIQMIRRNFNVASDSEWTIEANPEGLNLEKAKCFLDLGMNRVSLGMQSLHEKFLKYLGRCHDKQTALKAYEILRRAGLKNISVDLMCSFPGQTMQELEEDVRSICFLDSEHVSVYALTIEQNSRFYAQKVQLEDPHLQAEHYVRVRELLEENGLRQYEISNFAKLGFESKHNLNYWRGGNYFGLGVGAHSHQDGKRFWNGSRFADYMKKVQQGQSPVEGQEILKNHERLMEVLLFGLRMREGVDVERIQTDLSVRLDAQKRSLIDEFVRSRFLYWDETRLKTTLEGQLVLDELSMRLI